MCDRLHENPSDEGRNDKHIASLVIQLRYAAVSVMPYVKTPSACCFLCSRAKQG